jgi:hypothetical protein
MPAAARAHDQDTAPTAPLDAIPAKPEHKIGQLTTGELASEASKLEAALRRPFTESVKALLRARLDAVREEQAERGRKRDEDVAAAKAERAAQDADRAARDASASLADVSTALPGTQGGPY